MKKKRIILAIVVLLLPIQSFAQDKTEIITFNIHHSPIHVASPFQDIKVEATITDPRNVAYASVNYRAKGEGSFKTVFMTNIQKDIFEAIIPAMDVLPPGIEYYIFVMDIKGVPHVIFKDPKLPQTVAIAEETGVFEGAKTEAALEEEFGLFAAENVVYAAAKREQKITEAPAAISVISDDEIKDSGAIELYDVMRKVPGVDVMTLDPSYTLVGARGFLTEANRYMLVLMDGMVLNDEFFGQAFWTLFPITPADVKRIEVIRGPGSALYGANAYSGVTSIVTKSPKEAKGLYAIATRSVPLERDIPTLYVTPRGGGEVGGFGYRISANKTQVNSWFDPQLRVLDTVRANALIQYEGSGMKGAVDFGYVDGNVWAFSTLGPFQIPVINPHVKLSYDYKDAKLLAYWSGFQTEIGFDHIPGVHKDLLQELIKFFRSKDGLIPITLTFSTPTALTRFSFSPMGRLSETIPWTLLF